MSYYRQCNRMYKYLEMMLQKAGKNGMETDDLIYELTTKFEVSEKAIHKRIDLLERRGVLRNQMGVFVWQR